MVDYVHSHSLDILNVGDEDSEPGFDFARCRPRSHQRRAEVVFDGFLPRAGPYRAWTSSAAATCCTPSRRRSRCGSRPRDDVAARAVGILFVTVGTVRLVPRTAQAHGPSPPRCCSIARSSPPGATLRVVPQRGRIAFPLSTYEQTGSSGCPGEPRCCGGTCPRGRPSPVTGVRQRYGLTMRETEFLVSSVEGLGPRNAGRALLNVPGVAGTSTRTSVGARRPLAAGDAGCRAAAREHHRAAELGPGDSPRDDRHGPEPTRARRRRRVPAGDRRRLHAASFRVESGTGQSLSSWTPCTASRSCPRVWPSVAPGARVSTELPLRSRGRAVTDSARWDCFCPGASASPSDSLVTARSTPGRLGARRGSVRLASDATIWPVAPEIPPGTPSLRAVSAASRWFDRVLLLVERPSADGRRPTC